MPVHDQVPIKNHTADGKTVLFPFDFRTINANDLTVTFNGIAANINYTVVLTGDTGGNITFNTAPPANTDIQIRRKTPFSRDTDYQDNGDLLAQTLDDDFDRLWLALQEQRASSDATLTKATGQNEWDAKQMPITGLIPGTHDNDAATLGQVKTLNGGAFTSKNEAAASAAAAKVSETNAKKSENAAAASLAALQNSEKNAKASETAAKASQTAAKASQDAAKTSETNAGISAAAAKASETTVHADAASASTSASNALASQTSATASKNAAAQSAGLAKTSETNAKTSENHAKTSETNAAKSATDAATALASLNTQAADAAASATAAAGSASAARASQTAAAASATAAAGSETKVHTDATAATTAAAAAKTSQTAAKGSQDAAKASETAAAASAAAALTSEGNAGVSETNAAKSATDAAASARAAKTSETNAKASETAAKASQTAVAADKTIIDGYIDALKNSSAWVYHGEIPTGKDIDTFQPTDANMGIWQQSTPAQATTANGYPVAGQPGKLEIFAHGMYGGAMIYTTADGRMFSKHLSAAWNGKDGPWSSWYETGTARINSYGIGVTANSTKTSFDWQQYNFNVGEHILVSSNVWTNPPNGLPNLPGTSICHIHVLGAAGNVTQLELTTNNVNDANFVKYSLRMAGNKGSRTIKARQIFTSASVIPLEDGGTGASYTSKAALLQGLMDGFPLPLAADGSAPNDAVTMRQLGLVSGSGGASMTGVMNNFIGAVDWYNGARSGAGKVPIAGYIPADGQPVSRAAYPDLWEAVNKGVFSSVTDAQWLAGPGNPLPAGQYRGKYSKGGAAGTCPDKTITDAWFRVPDLNGVITSSIPALFLRGDAGGRIGTEIGSVGEVLPAAAPNIEGDFSTAANLGFAGLLHMPHGAFSENDTGSTANSLPSQALSGPTMADRLHTVKFRAQDSNQVYGRKNADGVHPATELRPNSVAGIWIIRASGAFTAANTSFRVISADATAPTTGESKGGNIVSSYQAAGVEVAAAGLQVRKGMGTPHSVASIDVFNKGGTYGGVEELVHFSFQSEGTAYAPTHWAVSSVAQISYDQMLTTQGAFFASDTDTGGRSVFCSLLSHQTGNGTVARSSYHLGTLGPASGQYGRFQMAGISDTGSIARLGICCSVGDVEFVTGTSTSSQTYTLNKTLVCDRKLKDDIAYTEAAAAEALANVDAMKPTTYVLNFDEQKRQRRGFIAQDLQAIDAKYVKKMDLTDDDGNPYSQLRLDNNALLLDALLAIHALSARVKELEAKLNK